MRSVAQQNKSSSPPFRSAFDFVILQIWILCKCVFCFGGWLNAGDSMRATSNASTHIWLRTNGYCVLQYDRYCSFIIVCLMFRSCCCVLLCMFFIRFRGLSVRTHTIYGWAEIISIIFNAHWIRYILRIEQLTNAMFAPDFAKCTDWLMLPKIERTYLIVNDEPK